MSREDWIVIEEVRDKLFDILSDDNLSTNVFEIIDECMAMLTDVADDCNMRADNIEEYFPSGTPQSELLRGRAETLEYVVEILEEIEEGMSDEKIKEIVESAISELDSVE